MPVSDALSAVATYHPDSQLIPDNRVCIFTHTIFNIILIYSDICATSSAVSLIVGVSKALHTLMASIGLETKLLIISILTKSYPFFPQVGRILFMADNQRDGLQGSIFKYHACAPKRPIVIEIND